MTSLLIENIIYWIPLLASVQSQYDMVTKNKMLSKKKAHTLNLQCKLVTKTISLVPSPFKKIIIKDNF